MGSICAFHRVEPGTRSALGRKAAELVSRWTPVATAGLTAIAYYVGSRVGFALTPRDTPIALFWPPNAILLSVFLLSPIRSWWICWLAVLPAHLLVQAQTGIPVIVSLGWYISNTGEALIGAAAICYLSRIRKTRFGFNDTRELKIFLLGVILVAPFLTSFLDAGTVVWGGYAPGYWTLWGRRLVSNILANLIIVPVVVTLCRAKFSWLRKATLFRLLELSCLGLGVTMVSIFAFGGPARTLIDFSPVMFAPLLFLLWAAVRFGAGGLSLSLLVVALISLGNAVHGLATPEADLVARNVLTMQILLAAFGVPLLWLSVLIKERRSIELSLGDRRGFLIQADHSLREVGRKLHRDLTQQLTLLTLDVERLSSKIEPWTSVQERLHKLNGQIARLSTATRDWSHVLDPINIEYLGLAGALAALCRHASEGSRITFTFTTAGKSEHLDATTSLSLYRVAQEAVENVLKLESIHTTKVRLEVSAECARLVVEHDGAETAAADWQESEFSVVGMRQRVSLLDGTFSIHSSNPGATIDVAVPLRMPNQ